MISIRYDTITKYMGISLIILAALNYFDFLTIPTAYLLGFSISALVFTLLDLIEYKVNESDDPYKFRKLKIILSFLAVSSFMVIPYIDMSWDIVIFTKINDTTVFLSISIIFFINSIKNDKLVSDQFEKIVHKKIQDIHNSKEFKEQMKNIINKGIADQDIEQLMFEANKKYKPRGSRD